MSSTKTKKILVTGGAGYIGSHTIIELLNAGYEVVSIDNFSHSTKETFFRIKKITGVIIKNYDVDLCDEKKVEAIFQKEKNISGVIHFAALKSVGESVNQPLKYFANNLGSLMAVLACMKKCHIPTLVFSSSCAVYGSVKKLPVSETTLLGVAESPYARTKQLGEMILEDVSKGENNLKILALRYFNPVGAHESGFIGEVPNGKHDNLVPIITETAIGKQSSMTVFGGNYKTRDGSAVRDYVHVSDIARAHVLALKHLEKKTTPKYDVINLGTGKGSTVLEMITAFEKATGQKLKYTVGPKRPGDIEAVYSDTKKAKKILGWKPELGLKEMMASAWKWQQNIR